MLLPQLITGFRESRGRATSHGRSSTIVKKNGCLKTKATRYRFCKHKGKRKAQGLRSPECGLGRGLPAPPWALPSEPPPETYQTRLQGSPPTPRSLSPGSAREAFPGVAATTGGQGRALGPQTACGKRSAGATQGQSTPSTPPPQGPARAAASRLLSAPWTGRSSRRTDL